MTVILFCGPTLPANVALEVLPEVQLRPPAACGDVYRAGQEHPAAIALVDGYFDQRLSVWHKEVLWALRQGIHVYGAASMGALRAAELHGFGMRGVGWVFEQFRAGHLEDDDEVAVVHDPATGGYRVRSEAMVNLRVTLQEAVDQRQLSEASRSSLVAHLKKLFYPHRTLQALRDLASSLNAEEAARLGAWLSQHGIIDRKLLDARALLLELRADLLAGVLAQPFQARPGAFQHTNAWQSLVDGIDRPLAAPVAAASSSPRAGAPRLREAAERPPDAGAAELRSLVDALRTQFPEQHASLLQRALERALAVALAREHGVSVDAAAAQRESEQFRLDRGLLGPIETARWLGEAGLDLIGFSALIHDNVLERELAARVRQLLCRQLADVLRIAGLTLKGSKPAQSVRNT